MNPCMVTKITKITKTPCTGNHLLIAAQAVNNNLVLVTRDKHFNILKETIAGNLELEVE